MKKLLVSIWLIMILLSISYVLWEEDWKYTLPTPVPENYSASKPVNASAIANKLGAQNGIPLFIHFFNPGCPCSKFNIPHVTSLVRKYSDKIKFVIVVMSSEKDYKAEDIREKFDLDIPVFFDSSIADSCGVYSTPQAVLIGSNRQLYYRGNYNRSRFCEAANTAYAQMAIDSLLANSGNLITDKAALRSYGCSLPKCTSTDGEK